MADINTGKPLKFEIAGKIYIGAGTSNILWIEEGSLKVTQPKREGKSLMDRGVLMGQVLECGQRPGTISFSFRPTKNGMTGASDVVALLMPDGASGLKSTYTIQIDIPDSKSASTGTRLTCPACWAPDGVEYGGRGGSDPDLVTVNLQSEGEWTPATY